MLTLDIDTLHDLSEPFFQVTLLTPQDRFFGEVELFPHRDLLAIDMSLCDQKQFRRPESITRFDTDILVLETYRHGSSRGILQDQPTFVSPGSIHLMDWSRDFTAITQNGHSLSLVIPHKSVGYDPSQHSGYVSLSRDSGRGRLLATSLELLVDELRSGHDDEASALSTVLLGMVRTLLLGDPDWEPDTTVDLGRRAMIERYIYANLDAEDLSIKRICSSLAMSRATVYRAFEGEGIERFIRNARLDRCFSELLRASPERGAVRRIAERWAFHDAPNFRRSFRTRFGVSPSDCIGYGERKTGRPVRPAIHLANEMLRLK